MTRRTHSRFLAVFLALLLSASAFAKNRPDIDALAGRKADPKVKSEVAKRVSEIARRGAPVHVEGRLGVPTFVWIDQKSAKANAPQGQGAERREAAMARAHLGKVANAYGLTKNDVIGAEVDAIVKGARGGVVVKFKQKIDGVEVFRDELNVVMDSKLDAVAVTGYIPGRSTGAANPGQNRWTRSAESASRDAVADATGLPLGGVSFVKSGSREGFDLYSFASTVAGVTLTEPVRMKQVWYHLPEGLVPAYYAEVITTNVTGEVMLDVDIDENAYAYVISAVDGSILFRKNLISHSAEANALPPGGFTYQVWADPVTGIPYDTPAGNSVHPKLVPVPDGAQHPFVPMQTVTLPNFPFSAGDPWLAPGATQTDGNNVDAFINWYSPDGLGTPTTTTPTDPPNGDHRAQITGADQFIYTHQPDVDGSSVAARSASIVQLFYNINFLHDWFYDSGFTETARNAQKNNFGRGGLQNDDIRAQAQDFQSFSNANMLTPSDGSRPRMRMYNFPNPANMLDVTAPAAVGKLRIGVSQTGTRAFDVTGNVVIATFTSGPTTCTITNAAALAGNIAMFDFDNTDGTGCSFSTRIARIHATSAAAALMVYTSGAPTSVANVTGINATHTKPIGVISWNSGQSIKAQLAVPTTVTARLFRMADRDGTLDNQIVFHEWGHYLSNRLIANANGLGNNQGSAMGEGWSDFVAMLLTVRADDTSTPSNATWGGPYALATYATSGVPYSGALNHGYYLGIRRTPYSTDMANYNALTFKHIANGEPAPTGPPIAWTTPNSQVHNSGEIWATMLWECYASLLRDTQGPAPRLTFQQAQDRMKQYLVASLAMTPANPTYLEARDAVLAAAYANDTYDYVLFLRAFAKRGAGIHAEGPDRFSTDHIPVVESYDAGAEIAFAGATLDDSVVSCDYDGTLDSGETGMLTVSVSNAGAEDLVGATATITSTTPGVTFPAGNTISFPPMTPFEQVGGAVKVAYASGIAGIQQIDFHLEFDDPALDAPRTGDEGFRANSDDGPAATSATDTVETSTTAWTLTNDPTLAQENPWTRVIVTPLDREWHVDNAGSASDQRLESPVFTVNGGGSFNLQFDHSWEFEAPDFDGGVVEMQVNGGAWTDIGTPAYNGTLVNYSGNLNPLRTRPAFVGTGSGSVSLTQAIAPGSTVRVRFRFGSDNAVGAPGWNVDNIAFNGVVETPFSTVIADAGCNTPPSAIANLTSSANPSPFGASLTLTATVTLLAGTADGTFTFYDGDTPLGPAVALVAGSASFTTSSLAVGPHLLRAVWNGGTTGTLANEPTLVQNISKIATSVQLVSSKNPSTECNPVTFTATVSATSGSPTGSVSFFDGATPLGTVSLTSGVAAFSVTSMTAGSHTISAVYNGAADFATSNDSLTQTVYPIPATPVASNGGPYCEGGTIVLSTPIVAGATYSWTGPEGFTSALRTPSIPAATLAMAGVYSVTVTVDGCTSPAGTTNVTVNPTPATPTITPGGPTTFCAGGSVTLTSSSATGNQWYLDGNPIGGATNQTYDATASGSYTVVVTTNSCPSAPSAATAVTVNPIPATPTITASGSTAFCPGSSVTLTSSSATGNQWYLDGNPIGGATNQTYAASTPGSYTVVVTASSCPSAPSAATVLTLAPAPNATITAPATAFNGSTGYTATTANAGAGATYNWSITGGTITAGNGTPSITFTTGAAGTLTINLTVTNAGGCSDSKSANVTVNNQRFNPNGDNTIDPADVFYLIAYLFTGGPAPSGAAGMLSGDANGDGIVDPADIFYVINHLFSGGPKPSGIDTNPKVASSSIRSMAGTIALGTPVRRGDRLAIPVMLTLDGKSEVPQAIALKVNLNGVSGATLTRAGASRHLATAFEATRTDDGSVSWIVAFDRGTPLALAAGVATQVGEIEFAFAGRTEASIDASVTMLADAAGSVTATRANGLLAIGESVTTVGPQAPQRQIQGVN